MQVDPSLYNQQLLDKAVEIKTLFKSHNLPEIEVFTSPTLNYRMRAEFRIWHDGNDLYHIMFDQQSKQKSRVDQFPPASELINALMLEMMTSLRNNAILRTKLFQIDYLTSLSGEAVVTLLYHKPLDDLWQAQAEQLQARLRQQYFVNIIGRARKQKQVLDRDFVIEKLEIKDVEYVFKHVENSFTQPNAVVNRKMIEWTQACSAHLSGDLIELYCGAGNFSIPLAAHFDNVIGTEIAKLSVEAALYNIDANKINNLNIVRLSAEEFVTAIRGERAFNRLKGIDLTHYNFSTVLVDPPRAGLDIDSTKLIAEFDSIIYISCNPLTLKCNLDQLCKTHTIQKFAIFDQFPYTPHIESGVFLQRTELNES
jgi:tRNA (uracil-5-)-methyltransferase